MEIKVTIEATGLEGAIHTLAQVLANYEMPVKDRESEKRDLKHVMAQKQETPLAIEEPKKEEVKSDEPTVSLETVRAKLASLSQAGKQKQVKELITSLGAKKLTEIPKEQYPELMARAEGL